MSVITLTSYVTGTVWEVVRNPGDRVDIDEAIVIVESMKMEIPVEATHAGHVGEVFVAKGDAVAEGQAIATIITD